MEEATLEHLRLPPYIRLISTRSPRVRIVRPILGSGRGQIHLHSLFNIQTPPPPPPPPPSDPYAYPSALFIRQTPVLISPQPSPGTSLNPQLQHQAVGLTFHQAPPSAIITAPHPDICSRVLQGSNKVPRGVCCATSRLQQLPGCFPDRPSQQAPSVLPSAFCCLAGCNSLCPKDATLDSSPVSPGPHDQRRPSRAIVSCCLSGLSLLCRRLVEGNFTHHPHSSAPPPNENITWLKLLLPFIPGSCALPEVARLFFSPPAA